MEVDQALAVAVLFPGHAVENRCRGGKILAKAFGKAAVDAGVILFGRDRQRQNFLFAQIGKAAALGKGGKHRSDLMLWNDSNVACNCKVASQEMNFRVHVTLPEVNRKGQKQV